MDTDQSRLLPVSVKDLERDLHPEQPSTASTGILLIDVRPNAQFCSGHIESAENVNFSNILLRRLLKGVVSLESLLPSTELAEKIKSLEEHGGSTESRKLVVYDWCSNEDGVKVELAKHAEVLATASGTGSVYFLNGGYDAFSAEFPSLCRQQQSKRKPPLGISVSTSLPVGFCGYKNKATSRRPLLTPSEDDGNRFGPPAEVLPHLALGCAKDSANLTQLRKMGITAILNVSHNCPNHFETLFEYKCIPVEDSHQADLLSKLETAFDFINSIKEKGGRVFVHCHAGISRSATVCIAYIMKHHQMDLTQAYDFVKQKRSCISPNLHFMGQLLEFQKRLQSGSCSSDSGSDGETEEEEMDCSATTCVDSILPTPLPREGAIDYTSQCSTTPLKSPRQEVLLCNSSVSGGSGYQQQIPVSVPHQQSSDCSAAVCSKRSVSVPGSLNFTLAKPKRRNICVAPPKFPVKYNQSVLEFHCSTDSILHSHSASTMTSRPTKLNLTSISLPTTPVNNQQQSKNHLSLSTSRSLTKATTGLPNFRLRQSLQLSPCRVVAKNWISFSGQSLDLSPIPTTLAN